LTTVLELDRVSYAYPRAARGQLAVADVSLGIESARNGSCSTA
jgi:hypothetical protein